MLRPYEDDPTPPRDSIVREIAIAALTTLAAGLATWAVDELREKYGKAKPSQPSETER